MSYGIGVGELLVLQDELCTGSHWCLPGRSQLLPTHSSRGCTSLPALHSGVAHWELETGHSGSVCSTEAGKCCRPGLCAPRAPTGKLPLAWVRTTRHQTWISHPASPGLCPCPSESVNSASFSALRPCGSSQNVRLGSTSPVPSPRVPISKSLTTLAGGSIPDDPCVVSSPFRWKLWEGDAILQVWPAQCELGGCRAPGKDRSIRKGKTPAQARPASSKWCTRAPSVAAPASQTHRRRQQGVPRGFWVRAARPSAVTFSARSSASVAAALGNNGS